MEVTPLDINPKPIVDSLALLKGMNNRVFTAIHPAERTEIAAAAQKLASATAIYALSTVFEKYPQGNVSKLSYEQLELGMTFPPTEPTRQLMQNANYYASLLSRLKGSSNWENFFTSHQEEVLPLGFQMQTLLGSGVLATLPLDYLVAMTLKQHADQNFPDVVPAAFNPKTGEALVVNPMSDLSTKHTLYIYSATPDYPGQDSRAVRSLINHVYPGKSIISPKSMPSSFYTK